MKKALLSATKASLVFDILVVLVCVANLIAGNGSTVEWIILILGDIFIVIPSTLRSISLKNKSIKEQEGQEHGSVVPSSDTQHPNE